VSRFFVLSDTIYGTVWLTLITHFGSPTQAVAMVPYVLPPVILAIINCITFQFRRGEFVSTSQVDSPAHM
jgi:hypothetical protein